MSPLVAWPGAALATKGSSAVQCSAGQCTRQYRMGSGYKQETSKRIFLFAHSVYPAPSPHALIGQGPGIVT
jgi:hypothetical protein